MRNKAATITGAALTVLFVGACGADIDAPTNYRVVERDDTASAAEAHTAPAENTADVVESPDNEFSWNAPEVDVEALEDDLMNFLDEVELPDFDLDDLDFNIDDFDGLFGDPDEPDNSGSEDVWEEYDRDAFPHWEDINGTGCDARQDVLARDLNEVVIANDGCTVESGNYYDFASGEHIEFVNDGNGGGVDIDHVVPLAYAAEHGNAMSWDAETRLMFANDEANLIAMESTTNQNIKSDNGPSGWMPADSDYHCVYAQQFEEVATAYGINIPAEDQAVIDNAC